MQCELCDTVLGNSNCFYNHFVNKHHWLSLCGISECCINISQAPLHIERTERYLPLHCVLKTVVCLKKLQAC